jgi:sulfite exporter TauE/SafE
MNAITFTMALLMGFTGSLHCAGMCGPIMWIMPFQFFKGFKKIFAIGLYHIGRISVYAFLAVILHSFRNLFEPQVQQYISVALGVSLLVIGIVSFVPNHLLKFKLPWAELVKKQLGNVVGKPGLGSITLVGILNGMLPCGLVYMALSSSMAATTTPQAAALMYLEWVLYPCL